MLSVPLADKSPRVPKEIVIFPEADNFPISIVPPNWEPSIVKVDANSAPVIVAAALPLPEPRFSVTARELPNVVSVRSPVDVADRAARSIVTAPEEVIVPAENPPKEPPSLVTASVALILATSNDPVEPPAAIGTSPLSTSMYLRKTLMPYRLHQRLGHLRPTYQYYQEPCRQKTLHRLIQWYQFHPLLTLMSNHRLTNSHR